MRFILERGSHRQKLPEGQKNALGGDHETYRASKDRSKPTVVDTSHLPPKLQRLDLIFPKGKFRPLDPYLNAEYAAALQAVGQTIRQDVPAPPPSLRDLNEEQLRKLAAEEGIDVADVKKGDRDAVLAKVFAAVG